MKSIVRLLAVLVVSFCVVTFVAGCGGGDKKTEPAKGDTKAQCSCEQIKKDGKGYCEHCGKGMCEGKESKCKDCCVAGKTCEKCAKAAAGGEPKKG